MQCAKQNRFTRRSEYSLFPYTVADLGPPTNQTIYIHIELHLWQEFLGTISVIRLKLVRFPGKRTETAHPEQ